MSLLCWKPKVFQHQHWVYVLHYTAVFLVISAESQLYLKGISTGNNYCLHWLKNKWKKVHKAEKAVSAAMQFRFSPWDPGQMSKCLKSSPFVGGKLGRQCTVLLVRKEWERKDEKQNAISSSFLQLKDMSERTSNLSDSPELIPAQEIIQPSHSCWITFLSFCSCSSPSDTARPFCCYLRFLFWLKCLHTQTGWFWPELIKLFKHYLNSIFQYQTLCVFWRILTGSQQTALKVFHPFLCLSPLSY